MGKMTADQIIIECLKSEGVKYWFGSIGEEQHSLLDQMYLDGNVRLFDTRHENSGVIVGIGYSQATGLASVCSGTVGSGVANMFNGMYVAHRSHVPIVAIVCKQPPGYWERHGRKSFDQSGVFRHITKWVIDVDEIGQLADALQRAFRVATTPTRGPVMVCVNKKLLSDAGGPEIEVTIPARENYKPASCLTYAGEDTIQRACELLLDSRFPALLIDDRLFWNNAEAELVELAEHMAMPICTAGTNFGPILPYDHPLWFGLLRSASSVTPMASMLLETADLWLVVDCDFALLPVGHFLPSPLKRVVQIDNDAEYIAKLYPIELGILGHSKAVLRQILDRVRKLGIDRKDKEKRLARLSEEKARWLNCVEEEVQEFKDKVPISHRHLIRCLSDVLPEDAYLVVSGGNISHFSHTLGLYRARTPRSVILRGEEASLGQGVCKAMGFKLANPHRPVVALCGDGEFWYGIASELETLKRHRLPITIVISNNGCLGTNRALQTLRYEGRYVGSDIDNPDFVLLAQAFDMYGERVTEPQHLGPAITRALNSGRPAIVDVATDPNEIPGVWYQRYKPH